MKRLAFPLLLALWLAALIAALAPGHARPGDLAITVRIIVHDATWLVLWIAGWAWVTYTREGTARLTQHTSLAAAAALIDAARSTLVDNGEQWTGMRQSVFEELANQQLAGSPCQSAAANCRRLCLCL